MRKLRLKEAEELRLHLEIGKGQNHLLTLLTSLKKKKTQEFPSPF